MTIRPCRPEDVAAVCAIYNHHVLHTTVTFEEEAVSERQMLERVQTYAAEYPWLVYEHEGQVAGYAYAARFHHRSAFRHTVESTVYVAQDQQRRGIGRALYDALLPPLARRGCHVVVAAIALSNEGSVGLHEALGFMQVGQLREVGLKFGRWIDVGFWQKTLR